MGKKILNSGIEPFDKASGERPPDPNDPDLKQFMAFARTFLMPMIVMKVFLLYFGLNYSQYPGEGYGYGLVVTLVVIVASFSYFLWSQRKNSNL